MLSRHIPQSKPPRFSSYTAPTEIIPGVQAGIERPLLSASLPEEASTEMPTALAFETGVINGLKNNELQGSL